MNNELFRRLLPHIAALFFFGLTTLAYFPAVLDGKVLQQSDILQWKGTAKEIQDFRQKTGEEPLWTNSLFGGMPAYQIDMVSKGNIVNKIRTSMLAIFPKPANIIFWTMAGFYLLLIVLGASPLVAAAGGVTFALSTYNMLIIEAGHVTKAMAIATIAPVVAGFVLAYRGRFLSGAAIAGLAFAFNIAASHYQITYYMVLLLACLGLGFLAEAFVQKQLPRFLKATVILLFAFALGAASDTTRLWTTMEYSRETMRGGSALREGEKGLDKDYALAWSYGVAETFTLLIPRFMGGASGEPISPQSSLGRFMKQAGAGNEQAPTYWGAQPFTGGPIYHGAVVCFLFLLGCFVVRGPLRWSLLLATILSVVLSWGKNFPLITDLFYNYFPMYNKFRVVSMILVIAQFTMPLLGFLALKSFAQRAQKDASLLRYLYISTGITAGLLVLLWIMAGSFDMTSQGDSRYPEQFTALLQEERLSMLKGDALRSLFLVLLAAGVLWAWLRGLLKETYALTIVGLLAIGDLWLVDRRYLDSDDFVAKRKTEAVFEASPADKQITQDQDPNFRVLNTTRNAFNDGITSYYHKSVGGYHGAKLSRYQDLIENHIGQNNMQVLNMLNTKYIITEGQGGQPAAQMNPDACGHAWFVNEVQTVADSRAEIDALKQFDPKKTAFADKQYANYLNGFVNATDSTSNIVLKAYQPNKLTYESNATGEGFAVFSEIYYNSGKGWQAYLDGKTVEHIRTDYLLRGMRLPAGKHEIVFKFEPRAYFMGEKIAMFGSLLLIGLCIGAVGVAVKGKGKS